MESVIRVRTVIVILFIVLFITLFWFNVRGKVKFKGAFSRALNVIHFSSMGICLLFLFLKFYFDIHFFSQFIYWSIWGVFYVTLITLFLERYDSFTIKNLYLWIFNIIFCIYFFLVLIFPISGLMGYFFLMNEPGESYYEDHEISLRINSSAFSRCSAPDVYLKYGPFLKKVDQKVCPCHFIEDEMKVEYSDSLCLVSFKYENEPLECEKVILIE